MLYSLQSRVQLLVHFLLDVLNGLCRVQVFGTCVGAVHDCVTSIQLECVVELCESFHGFAVAAVADPSIRLHEHGRSEILIAVPPIRRTRRGAARAQNALVHAVQTRAVCFGLEEFSRRRSRRGRLEPRLYARVLRVEGGQVGNKILDDRHMRQRIDRHGIGVLSSDAREARERVSSVDVHGARSADAFAAGASEGERRVGLVLDLNERVENHRTARRHVDVVRLQVRRCCRVWVPSIDLKRLRLGGGRRRRRLWCIDRGGGFVGTCSKGTMTIQREWRTHGTEAGT